MAVFVNTELIKDLKRFGATNIDACYNCGNCTAVCPLSEEIESFPRKLIRYSQIGLKDRLLGSRELWLCYYCGECSETCPREAEPGELMASARRYAISSYDPIGLAKLIYTSPAFNIVFIIVLSVILGLFMISTGSMPSGIKNLAGDLKLYSPFADNQFSFQVIHWSGIAIFTFLGLVSILTIINMVKYIRKSVDFTGNTQGKQTGFIATKEVVSELLSMKRYQDCEKETEKTERQPWYSQRWFLHWTIMWGFVGLAVSTVIDMVIGWFIKDVLVGTVWIGHPYFWLGIFPRVLGIVSGVVLLYGVIYALLNRAFKINKYYSNNLLSDWVILWMLFIIGVTGFFVLVSVYMGKSVAPWAYYVFLVHSVLAMLFLLLAPFSKLIHALYRPMALWIHAYLKNR